METLLKGWKDAIPLRMNISGMLWSSVISKEAPILIFQITCSLGNVCLSVREHMLLLRVCYVNLLKGHHKNEKQVKYSNLIYCPADNSCVVYKVCRSSSVLRRYVVLHRWIVVHGNPISPIKDTEYIGHICLKTMKLNAGLELSYGPWMMK